MCRESYSQHSQLARDRLFSDLVEFIFIYFYFVRKFDCNRNDVGSSTFYLLGLIDNLIWMRCKCLVRVVCEECSWIVGLRCFCFYSGETNWMKLIVLAFWRNHQFIAFASMESRHRLFIQSKSNRINCDVNSYLTYIIVCVCRQVVFNVVLDCHQHPNFPSKSQSSKCAETITGNLREFVEVEPYDQYISSDLRVWLIFAYIIETGFAQPIDKIDGYF